MVTEQVVCDASMVSTWFFKSRLALWLQAGLERGNVIQSACETFNEIY